MLARLLMFEAYYATGEGSNDKVTQEAHAWKFVAAFCASDMDEVRSVPPQQEPIPEGPSRHPRGLLAALAIFLLSFAALQGLYSHNSGGVAERIFVETLGSHPAVLLINVITPDIHAQAKGARILATGGGINIRAGCEGSEVLFLLVSAFLAVSLPWGRRLTGLITGAVLLLVLNQCRILALFYSFRSNRELFDLLHTIVAPIVLISLTGLFFHAWLQQTPRAG